MLVEHKSAHVSTEIEKRDVLKNSSILVRKAACPLGRADALFG